MIESSQPYSPIEHTRPTGRVEFIGEFYFCEFYEYLVGMIEYFKEEKGFFDTKQLLCLGYEDIHDFLSQHLNGLVYNEVFNLPEMENTLGRDSFMDALMYLNFTPDAIVQVLNYFEININTIIDSIGLKVIYPENLLFYYHYYPVTQVPTVNIYYLNLGYSCVNTT